MTTISYEEEFKELLPYRIVENDDLQFFALELLTQKAELPSGENLHIGVVRAAYALDSNESFPAIHIDYKNEEPKCAFADHIESLMRFCDRAYSLLGMTRVYATGAGQCFINEFVIDHWELSKIY